MPDTLPLTVTSLDIAGWANRLSARALLPVLVRRLIHESPVALTAVDFPGYDEAQRHGWDGWSEAEAGAPWVPVGAAGWELSVADDNPGKPNRDWASRIALSVDERAATTFIFVTARRWPGKQRWAEQRRRERLWADVRTYDAEDLAQWLEQSPATRLWFASELGRPVDGLRPLDQAWNDWSNACRPALSVKLFDEAVAQAANDFAGWRKQSAHRPFVVTADSVGEAVAFVAAALEPISRERSIVVEDVHALPAMLAEKPTGLIVIADPQAEAIAAVAVNQHQIVFARTHTTVPVEVDVALGPTSRGAFEAALAEMGIAEYDRDRITTEAGRSPTILRRRLAIAPALRVPEWARDPILQRKLMPILLAGAWRAEDKADETCVVEIAGKPVDEIERDAAELAALPDAPVWATAGFRGVVSRKDALFAIHHSLTEQDLARFLNVAELVLTLDDPRLDLPEDKRWAASMYGVHAEVSGALREAVGELLVLLAIEGDRLLGARLGPIAIRVDRVVAAVLKEPTPRRWLAQHHLRWLAEASPDAFLDAVEADLRRDEPALLALMHPVASTFGGCDRTELLWALELLAWEPRRFPRVFAILARLSEIRINDNWMNKPEASLGSLVRCWWPQTSASIEERIAVLRRFVETRSPVAWRLLLAQFPHYGHASPNMRPRWREVRAGAGDQPSVDEFREVMFAALDLLVDWPDYSVEQIGDLLSLVDEFPDDAVAKLLGRAESWGEIASDIDRAALRERLRRDVRLWRREEDGEVPSWEERLRSWMEALAPSDILERNRWLFAAHWIAESSDDINDEERWRSHPERLEALRAAALRDVLAARGSEGVISLISGGEAAGVIGQLLARVDSARVEFWVRELLHREELGPKADEALRGLVMTCAADERQNVLTRLLDDSTVSDTDRLRALLAGPFEGATWRLLADREPQLGDAYWQQVFANAYGLGPIDTAFMIDRLLAAGRPFTAFRAISLVIGTIDPLLLARVLRALKASQGDDIGEASPHSWHFGEAVARVAREKALPQYELAGLEFAFFRLLEHDQHGTPNLDRVLAETPADFMHLIKLVYKRDDGQIDQPEEQKAAAQIAFSILHQGRRIPGTADEGGIDGDALIGWIDAVRALSRDAARQEATDHVIGTLLAASPVGADGCWPHEAVRRALDHLGNDDVARGFIVGKRNARGVVMRGPGGNQERALAAEFRHGADAMRLSFPFTARTLDRLADDYERDARRWDGEDQVERRLGRR